MQKRIPSSFQSSRRKEKARTEEAGAEEVGACEEEGGACEEEGRGGGRHCDSGRRWEEEEESVGSASAESLCARRLQASVRECGEQGGSLSVFPRALRWAGLFALEAGLLEGGGRRRSALPNQQSNEWLPSKVGELQKVRVCSARRVRRRAEPGNPRSLDVAGHRNCTGNEGRALLRIPHSGKAGHQEERKGPRAPQRILA